MENLSHKLSAALDKFTGNYREHLNHADIDENTRDALDLLGADIKHLFDDLIKAVDEI